MYTSVKKKNWTCYYENYLNFKNCVHIYITKCTVLTMFRSEQFCGVKYIHTVVQPPLPSISRTFSYSPLIYCTHKHHFPLPSSPSPWQPSFYFVSLYVWPHISGIIPYCLIVSGSFHFAQCLQGCNVTHVATYVRIAFPCKAEYILFIHILSNTCYFLFVIIFW